MAAEFFSSTAANTVGNLATEYATPYLSYFFRFAKIVEDFKLQRNTLELKIDRVKNDVEEAQRQTEIIEKDVEDWLTRAGEELGEAQSLEDEIEGKKCFNWCPSWGWRYCLSKKVAKKTLLIAKLLESCNFPRVGRRAPLQGIELLLPKDFMASESSTLAFNEIMDALKSDGVKMIGLHGMPGVGKTTLAEVVGKQASQQKLFDKVVIVSGVSQNPDINKIQRRIAETLGLKFEASTEEGRAEELWRRLKGERKILIILDDVWKELELQTIGISIGREHEGCKILLTTRLQQVCIQMNCQEIFELKILSEDEAWALLKDKAGVEDVSPTLEVAKEVARECYGLPLAIVTVAKALKGKNLNGWILANQRLKDSRHLDNQDVCGGIYSSLELSYDYLENNNIKSCFLLCSLFPEDFEIPVEILVICGIGQGLFSNVHSLELLRREICEALIKLQQSGLLLETDDEGSVKMHDVVRDFAHWITSRGDNTFMVKDGLTEWPMSESFDCYVAISLWHAEIDNLPQNLEFSKLKTLFVSGSLLNVSSTFFEGMKSLQVLLLNNVKSSLEALQFLTNLRTLCFIGCELENISSVRNMNNLEILALFDTKIKELPEGFEELHRLKSLYFSTGMEHSNFPPNLLSRLASLQELHVTSKNNANLLELNSLSRLTGLTMRLSTDQCSQENFVFPELERYNIVVNEDIEELERQSLRSLGVSDFSSSLNAFRELFRNLEKLAMSDVSTKYKNIVPNVDRWGLNKLTSLELTKCNDLDCLIDTTREQSPTTAFSNLVKLKMVGMTCLKELCIGQPPIRFLQKLETLTIYNCQKLQSVFQLYKLSGNEEIQIQKVSNLRSLELSQLPSLESIWSEPAHHVSLQSLKEVTIYGCVKLKQIFSPYLTQDLLHLEQLKIDKCEELEQVFTFDKEMAKLEVAPLSNLTSLELEDLPALESIWSELAHHVSLQSLKVVKVKDCNKMGSIFSPSFVQSLLHLEELEISRCRNLEKVFAFDKEVTELEENQAQPLSNLSCMRLESLPKLRCIWRGPTHFLNPRSFEYMEIISCSKLDFGLHGVKEFLYFAKKLHLGEVMYPKNLIPNLDPKGLNGKDLEYFIDTTQGHVSTNAFFNLVELHIENMIGFKMLCNGQYPKGFLQKLEKLEAKFCDEMVSVPPAIQNLKEVKISYCDQLQVVFQIDEIEENQGLLLTNLTLLDLTYLQELKWIWKGSTCFVSLQSLKIANISKCHKLEYLFSPSLAQSLVLLEQLIVDNCDGLQHIIAELDCDDEAETNPHLHSSFLPNLGTLGITHCPRLKHVLSIPVAQVLPRLKSFLITDSPQLEQVFRAAKENNIGVNRAIVLPCLKYLYLENLINLSCFYSENFFISLPSLEKLWFVDCPKLIDFTIQKEVDEQALLKELFVSKLVNGYQLRISANCNQDYIAIGNLEEVFQVQGEYSLSSIETLHLEDLSQAKTLWKDVTFENLTILSVINCKRLRLLFPLGSTRCLSQLRELFVRGNSNLEKIFELEDDATEKDIKFDQLRKLTLEELPGLVDFCPRGYHFLFPDLELLQVRNCPKVTTTFFIDSKRCVHAKIETQQLVELYWYGRSDDTKLPPYEEEL